MIWLSQASVIQPARCLSYLQERNYEKRQENARSSTKITARTWCWHFLKDSRKSSAYLTSFKSRSWSRVFLSLGLEDLTIFGGYNLDYIISQQTVSSERTTAFFMTNAEFLKFILKRQKDREWHHTTFGPHCPDNNFNYSNCSIQYRQDYARTVWVGIRWELEKKLWKYVHGISPKN